MTKLAFAAAAFLTIGTMSARASFIIVDNSTVQVINGFRAYGTSSFTPSGGSYPANDAIDAAPNTGLCIGKRWNKCIPGFQVSGADNI